MSKKTRLERLRNSRLGRLLCRLLGEEKGAVMMEYVILAVLIAAAAVVAVAMFGKTLVGMFDTAGKGATADHAGAAAGKGAAGNHTGAKQTLETPPGHEMWVASPTYIRNNRGEWVQVTFYRRDGDGQSQRVSTSTKVLSYEQWRQSKDKGSTEQ